MSRFEERELIPDSVIRNFRITAADGNVYTTGLYLAHLHFGIKINSFWHAQILAMTVIHYFMKIQQESFKPIVKKRSNEVF